MKYLKCFIFSLSLFFSLNSFANDETPWAFNAPEAEGYAIKLTASDPLPGTPLVAGEEVQLKVSGSYSMTIAKNGTIILVTQDEKNNLVVPGEKQIKQTVNNPEGKFELTQPIQVPKEAKEIRLFIPLVPEGLKETTGEIVIRYPVVAKINLSNAQEEIIKSTAKIKTEEFLYAKESGKFKKAYKMLGSDMKSIADFTSWKSGESDYIQENLGKLISRDIWRMTLYNNPPNAPKPGLYIAADYENVYEKSPIHCGFVIWYLPTAKSKEYVVMREEHGNITNDILKKIPKEKLQDVRKQIGCRAL